jgi:hypothetical protein
MGPLSRRQVVREDDLQADVLAVAPWRGRLGGQADHGVAGRVDDGPEKLGLGRGVGARP